MHVIALDLGGTKLAAALFDETGHLSHHQVQPLEKRQGKAVGALIIRQIERLLDAASAQSIEINGIGISVPGIYYSKTGRVWAPNIPGWTDYPLLDEVLAMPQVHSINVKIDSDRACYILGETWQGAARGCKNAIFLAIGTGIGAGILVDGQILRGYGDIAGAVGWMALDRRFLDEYRTCGCFEYHASGLGLARIARTLLASDRNYSGILRQKNSEQITSHDIFAAHAQGDPIATKVLDEAIVYWGMAVANLVSIFNPEKIVIGGGVFGPAVQFLDKIVQEAERWAQPISMRQVAIEVSTLGGDAGLLGAGRLAFLALNKTD